MKILSVCLSLFLGLTAQAQSSIDSLQLIKDIRTLSLDKFEGRRAGSKGSRMAQFYLRDRFKEIGIQPYHNTFEYPFYFQDGDKQTMGTNLFGYIKGKSDSVIVVSAHYDHLGIKKGQAGKDSIYNGADDNASGVGGLLSIATYFKKHPPEHTLLFVSFDGEEEGLQGAKAFVKQPPVSASLIMLNINMDMLSRNDKNELYVCGLTPFPRLKSYVDAATAGQSKVKLLSGHDRKEDGAQNWINQSDHYEFYKLKIPFLYFGVEDHPDYHQLSDEFEHIQPSFYYQAVQHVLKVLQAADKGI
ncbi:Peptidase family M28 [Chitinophaga sp. CF118]|uniref:M28 family peptidase n=1 Tax=Chitinophaga sp. CF118 TaxID=1884367 RepID=UPI0008EB0F0F|nr:M28 family peptidase [Chitinophaga sp. CF118]SFE68483.1 Peptidase family M28 [Chitinophaga sp. CF118]